MNNGLYRGSRWFRMWDYKERSLREVLEKEGGEAIVESSILRLLERNIITEDLEFINKKTLSKN